jgi:glycosyltransferase involved in cell wall biosynthesis
MNRVAAPLVSVLLPVRDGAEHLVEAVDSLSDQTLSDLEVIVVDDGSVDESPELVRRDARRDRRFRLVLKPRLGPVAALERARSEARARYMARVDGDEWPFRGGSSSRSRRSRPSPGSPRAAEASSTSARTAWPTARVARSAGSTVW